MGGLGRAHRLPRGRGTALGDSNTSNTVVAALPGIIPLWLVDWLGGWLGGVVVAGDRR